MKLRVAIVYGGRSGEHEISLRSAQSIRQALDPERYKIIEYFISPEGKWRPRPIVPEPHGNPEIDVVFPALHGTFGEDGTVQGLLELADLAYVGPGVLASAVAMDKEVFKRVMRERGLPVVEAIIMRSDKLEAAAAIAALPFPMFVKPANLGSSVGISKAKNAADLQQALAEAALYDSKIVVERGIDGREFECAVLGNLDPVALFAPRAVIEAKVDEILRQAGGRPGHIFNLGHGLLPETPVENVRAVVERVHERRGI